MALHVVPRERLLGRALLIPLGLVFLCVGVATALVMPFLSLFLTTAVHASPVQVTVFLVAAPLSGVAVSTLVGRFSDRRAVRRQLLIGAALCGLVGSAVAVFARDYTVLLLLTITATAMAGALYPQMFAYAREIITRDGGGRTAMAMSTLRSVFSLAWVAGPPVGAVLLRVGGFRLVFAASAGMYALVVVLAVFRLSNVEPATAVPDDAPAPTRRLPVVAPRSVLLLTAAAFTLLQSPLTLGAQVLPLFIDTNLHGDVTQAGLILGLCAALEVPMMLGLGVLTTRVPLRVLVLAGACCGVAYNALAMGAGAVWVLAVGQLANSALIAAVSGVGITYMQDMLPEHPGRATTLFTNSFPVGAVLAGPLFGLAQHFGFRLAYVFGTVLCLLGLGVLLVARPSPVPGQLP